MFAQISSAILIFTTGICIVNAIANSAEIDSDDFMNGYIAHGHDA